MSNVPFPVIGIPADDLVRTKGRSGYLYLITNLINGKQYVGQTYQTLHRRWNGHRQSALKPATAISYALRKHGVENFEIKYLCRVESRDLKGMLDALERYYIKTLNTMWPKGYNIHSGGRNGPLSDTTKEKLRQAHLGRKASPETRAKMSMSGRGRKLSEHQREALRRANQTRIPRRGFTISDRQRAQVSAVHKGKVLSPETRAKISASVKADIIRKRALEEAKYNNSVAR